MRITRRHEDDLLNKSELSEVLTAVDGDPSELDDVSQESYEVGDRFIVEIDGCLPLKDGSYLYQMKGFNVLNFDKAGLDRLEKVSTHTFAQAIKDAAYLARKKYNIGELIQHSDAEIAEILKKAHADDAHFHLGDLVQFTAYDKPLVGLVIGIQQGESGERLNLYMVEEGRTMWTESAFCTKTGETCKDWAKAVLSSD